MKDEYSDGKSDLFAAFFYRTLGLVEHGGQLGFMSPFVWMFISSYQKVRERFTQDETITSLIQLEYSGFDGATVPICAFTLQRGHIEFKAAYVRLSNFVGAAQQAPRALEIIQAGVAEEHGQRGLMPDMAEHFYRASAADFAAIPGTPVVYWLSEKMLAVFAHPPIGSRYQAKAGPGTRDDQVFLRLHWEVDRRRVGTSNKWVLTDKAGEFRKWYAGCSYVMDWEDDGYRIRHHTNPDGSLKSRPQNTQFMFREGVTWGKVGSGETSFRWRPQGLGFNDAAPTLFGPNPFRLLGPLNSATATLILSATGSTLNVQTGMVADLPFGDVDIPDVSQIAAQLVVGSKSDWDSNETSWSFTRNPLVALVWV